MELELDKATGLCGKSREIKNENIISDIPKNLEKNMNSNLMKSKKFKIMYLIK